MASDEKLRGYWSIPMASGAAQRAASYARMQDRLTLAAVQGWRIKGHADERPIKHSEGGIWRSRDGPGTVSGPVVELYQKQVVL